MDSTQASSFSRDGSRAKFGCLTDWRLMYRITWALCIAWSSRPRIRLTQGEVVLGPLTRKRLGKELVIVPEGLLVATGARGGGCDVGHYGMRRKAGSRILTVQRDGIVCPVMAEKETITTGRRDRSAPALHNKSCAQ